MSDGGFIDAYLHTFGLAAGSNLSQLFGHSLRCFIPHRDIHFASQQARTAVPITGSQPGTLQVLKVSFLSTQEVK